MQKINFVLNLDKVYHWCYNNYSRSLIDCDCEKLREEEMREGVSAEAGYDSTVLLKKEIPFKFGI